MTTQTSQFATGFGGTEVPPSPMMRPPLPLDAGETRVTDVTRSTQAPLDSTTPVVPMTLPVQTYQQFQQALPQLQAAPAYSSVAIAVPSGSAAATDITTKAAQVNVLLAKGYSMADVNRMVYGF